MAIPNFISGIFGVTEPAIYGILLPLKKPFIISCIAGGIGGAFYGHFNFRKFAMGGMGIFEVPNMMNPDGTMDNIIIALIGIGISMIAGFLLTMMFYKDKEETAETAEDSKTDTEDIVIASPLKGTVIRLEEVEDAAFSSGALYAPADGTITAMFPTGHAIGMISNSGAEILMHIGMDTVQLEGRGFKPLIQPGDKVKKGQKLLEFDMALIKEAGYSLTTPVLITNSGQFAQVAAIGCRHTEAGETLLTIS